MVHMTAKYNLTKLYSKGERILVQADSLKKFLSGESVTLEHIVEYQHGLVQVRAKPKVDNYKNYVPVNIQFY